MKCCESKHAYGLNQTPKSPMALVTNGYSVPAFKPDVKANRFFNNDVLTLSNALGIRTGSAKSGVKTRATAPLKAASYAKEPCILIGYCPNAYDTGYIPL